MKVVFLYGPPGVGKLTVARSLASLIGYKVFHNHQTIDLVSAYISPQSPNFSRLISHLRAVFMAAAASEGINLILTYVYARGEDEADVEALCRPFLEAGGEVHFVQLMCDPAVHPQRVAASSRAEHGKVRHWPKVARAMSTLDLSSPMPGVPSLCLDITHLPPEEAARQIAGHFRLAHGPALESPLEPQAP